jgi:hypothetical protein
MARMAAPCSVEELREILSYDAETGALRWLRRAGKARGGDEAGCINDRGYRYIGVGGLAYRAHRLAWYLATGEWPPDEVDHVNGRTDDNRLANLRLATRLENAGNQRTAHRRNRSTGVLGVYRERGRFMAQIYHAGRREFLGSFETVAEASAAYWKRKRELHTFAPAAARHS